MIQKKLYKFICNLKNLLWSAYYINLNKLKNNQEAEEDEIENLK